MSEPSNVVPLWRHRGWTFQERARGFLEEWDGAFGGRDRLTFEAQVQELLEVAIADATGAR